MLSFKSKKISPRKINRLRLNPLADQVKQMMGNRDQSLILMVRG
ncbi:MAG: hypothetical protein WCV81_05485 [Microgenomates group bacterium]